MHLTIFKVRQVQEEFAHPNHLKYSLSSTLSVSVFSVQSPALNIETVRVLYVRFYLREGTGSLPDHPDHPQRDADHWGHGHEPADTIAPVRVGVHVVVLQWFVFNQEKQENSLKADKQKKTFCLQILIFTLWEGNTSALWWIKVIIWIQSLFGAIVYYM